DRFVWSSADGRVRGSGDLGFAQCSHISSSLNGSESSLTAWVDLERALTMRLSSESGREVRTVSLPDELEPVAELVVVANVNGPLVAWVRVGSTWHGWSCSSVGPSTS